MTFLIDGPVVILGGGPAGLGAATEFDRMGFTGWTLCEKEAVVGGMSRSFLDDKGYTWDVGGHITFSHYELFTRLLNGLLGENGWIEHQRESWIRLLNTWVPYPFQNNLHRLPPQEKARCLEGLIRVALDSSERTFGNFHEFILRTFGDGIADLFMLPYNTKVWGFEPKKLDAGWIADRVSVPDPTRVARNVALDRDDVDWGPNSTFRFPRHGGTGAIWTAVQGLLPGDNIQTGAEAVELNLHNKTVTFADGKTLPYEKLISTIPLTVLAEISGHKPWIELAQKLVYSSTHVVGVGIKGAAPKELETKCWMYFPEDNSPFYRVTHFSFYSPNNVDDIGKHWSLMCEVSESADKPVDEGQVVDQTIQGLVASGLIQSPDQVVHSWTRRFEYTYPTPTPGRDAIVHRLLTEMADAGIYSRGRFGAWKYEVGNMDHSFMQGFEAAAHLLFGSPELTVWEPALVNSPHSVLGYNRLRG